MNYTVVIDRGPTSYGAHVADLPSCVAAADTKAGVSVLIREAIELYIEVLEEGGRPIPAQQAYELAMKWEQMLTTKTIPFDLPEPGVKIALKVIDQTGFEHTTVIDDPRSPLPEGDG